MIDAICASIHNYFTDAADIRVGDFEIEDGALQNADDLKTGQYYRIVGSYFNDGVYQHPAEGLIDEAFSGQIWPMRLPRDFLTLCENIAAWQDKYGDALAGPYSSENVIGVYSYTKGSNAQEATGAGWEKVFRSQLNRWRKLS